MATFLLCHGGWSGAWEWKEVAEALRRRGHEAYTPTFTGLGERAHLANPEVDLNTYIEDIVMVLSYEELHDVILVGYSISGPVILGVAEAMAERLRHLVFIDAYVLEDGQSMADQVNPLVMSYLVKTAKKYGDGWRIPPNLPDAHRHTDQAIAPILTPLHLHDSSAAALPRTFVFCKRGREDIGPLHRPIAATANQVRQNSSWRYVELETGHRPMMSAPSELVEILLDIPENA
jgi:pimeloyl-ACP methyl ester carboxylesterase